MRVMIGSILAVARFEAGKVLFDQYAERAGGHMFTCLDTDVVALRPCVGSSRGDRDRYARSVETS